MANLGKLFVEYASMSPALAMIVADLRKLKKQRRTDLFQAYMQSQKFRDQLGRLAPEHLETCFMSVARVRAACKLPTPAKPIGQGHIRWTPELKAKLARAYTRFGPTAHVAVAAEMGLSEGQARLAKRRFLDLPSAALPLAA